MADNQIFIPDLNRIINELMSEHCQGVEEVRLEPQYETVTNAEQENQPKMETIPEKIHLVEEEEMPFRMSPLSHSYPDMTENFPVQAESSIRGEGNTEIMEMLISIKKDMEEKEQKWEKQQQIRKEFLEADFRRKEQLLELTLR